MHVIRTRPDTAHGPVERFTGTVWVEMLVTPSSPSRASGTGMVPPG